MGSNARVDRQSEPLDRSGKLEARTVLPLGPLLALALVGFALRWLNVAALEGTPLYRAPHGDGLGYLSLAAKLREAGVAGLFSEGPVYYQAPLYPHLMALFQWFFGESLSALRIFQAVLGGASVFLMGLGTARVFGRRAGLAAAFLLAFFAPSIWLDGLVQKSAAATVLASALMALWSYSSTRAAAAMGAVLGLLMLTRGEARLLVPVVGAALLWRDGSRKWASSVAPFACGLALVLAPVFVRNGVLGGDWVLTTSQAGTNLYIGNHAGATGSYTPLVPGRGDARFEASDAQELAEAATGGSLTPSEVSSHWRSRALADMRADPAGAARLLGRKGLLALNNAEVADTDDFSHARRDSWVLRLTLPFTVLLGLAALGLAIATQEERRRSRVFLAMAAAQWVALVAFYVFARYRLPLALFLVPLAGLGASNLQRVRSQPVAALGAALFAAALSLLPVYDPRAGTAAALTNEGRVLVDAGEFEAARLAAEEAVYLAPGFFDAHRLRSLASLKLGETDAALPSLERAHALVPTDWQVRAWLGIAMGEKGNLPRAFELLNGAAMERPEAMPIVSNAVGLAVALGRPAEAVQLLRHRIAAFPEELDVPLRLQLAWILSTSREAGLRDGSEALSVLGPLGSVGSVGSLGESAQVLDVRAAALAENGQFDAAHGLTTNAEHRAAYADGRAWRE